MNNLTFQEDGHIYRLNGVEIPSVTEILKEAGLSDMSKIPASVLERALNFGKAVHKAIELSSKGSLCHDSLDPLLLPYLNGWKAFVEDFGYVCQKYEYRHHHGTYRYGLTIDQAGIITKGKYQGATLGDIKTGQPYPSHKFQLAGYKLAIGKHYNTFILYLNPDFKPRGYKVVFATNNKREQGVFLAALTLYNVRKEEKLI